MNIYIPDHQVVSESGNKEKNGYLHESYVESLREFGTPHSLPRSGGCLLKRQIPHTEYTDAMGCYPLFTCQNWRYLGNDFREINDQLISVVLVADPFGDYTVSDLQQCFPHCFFPFKEHYVVDLRVPLTAYVSTHHQRNAQKALKLVQLENCEDPVSLLDTWESLYGTLIQRHHIQGISAFSRQAFAKQLAVPGLVMQRAVSEGETVGMLLWYIQNDVAYYHLGAYSPRGYELRASFALFRYAIDYFSQQGLGWLNLGAGAGTDTTVLSGLSRFKSEWSTGTRTAYLCGRIFNQKVYAELVNRKGIAATRYFPAYRLGEFQ